MRRLDELVGRWEAFSGRHPGVGIRVEGRAVRAWWLDEQLGACPQFFEASTFEGLLDLLEVVERHGCTFGRLPVDEVFRPLRADLLMWLDLTDRMARRALVAAAEGADG